MQQDGKIIIVGGCHNGIDSDFCIARLTANGALDTTFVGPQGNAGGKFGLPIGDGNDGAPSPWPYNLMAESSWRNLCRGAVNKFCLARLQGDGNLDTSFNGPDAAGTGGATARAASASASLVAGGVAGCAGAAAGRRQDPGRRYLQPNGHLPCSVWPD